MMNNAATACAKSLVKLTGVVILSGAYVALAMPAAAARHNDAAPPPIAGTMTPAPDGLAGTPAPSATTAPSATPASSPTPVSSPTPGATPAGSATPAPTPAPLVDRGMPTLPDLNGLEAPIAAQLRKLEAEVEGAPNDLDQAGRLAMLYQAYDLLPAADQAFTHLRVRQPEVFRWTYLHACVLQARGQLGEAADGYRQALAMRPDYLPAHIGLVGVLAQQGAYREALELLVPIQERFPEDPVIAHRLGMLYLEIDEPVWTVQFLKPILDRHPNLGGVRISLAEAFRKLGQPERADELLARLGNDRSVPVLVDPELAAIFAETTGTGAEERRGLTLLAQGDAKGALAHFEKALTFNPDSVTARAGRVDALVNLGDLARAEELLKADHAARHDEATLMQLADVYLLQDRLQEAEQTVAQLRLSSRIPPSLYANLEVRLAMAQKDYAKAKSILEPIVASDPRNAAAWHQLGEAHLGLAEVDAAQKALARALELNPGMAEAMDAMAEVYLVRNEPGAALTWYRKAAEHGALLAEQNCLPVVTSSFDMANYAVGARALLDCHAAYPKNADLADMVVRLYAMCPDPKYRNASLALELAQRLYGEDPSIMTGRALTSLAAAYAEGGDFAKAQELTHAAIERAKADRDSRAIERNAELLQLYRQEKRAYEMN